MRLLLLALLLCVGPARAADNFFSDLIVGETGYLVGNSDDRFIVSGDFLNASTQRTLWSTDRAELSFQGTAHVLEAAGADRGPFSTGAPENFAWGTLGLAAGATLVLQDGNAAPGAAQYVGGLRLDGGVGQISSITGNGVNLYYDPSLGENAYLGGGTFPLAGGGEVAPLGAAVPSLAPPSRFGLGLLTMLVSITLMSRSGGGCWRYNRAAHGHREDRLRRQ